MSNSHRGRRAAAAAAAASLALSGAVIAAAPAATAAPANDVDYFADVFPGLRHDSVFTAVTFERFEQLLQSDGTYAFLIGGPANPTTAATVAEIDAVAQQYGVEAVYTFDPLLDGESVDIRSSVIPEVAALWTRLQNDYLNKDTTPAFSGSADDPYLFVYDKSHTESGAEDRIVSSIAGAVDAASVDSDEEREAYRTQVAAVFDAVATGGVADLDTQSQYEFFSTAVNGRHTASYADASLYGGDIFTPDDAADFALQSITYPELVHLLESEGSHTILFGGTWCHNTRAVIGEVNDRAADAGVEPVYVFDLRLDGWSNPPLHVRDTASSLAYLYGEIANGYLDNLRTQYVTNGSASQRVDYYPGGDTTLPLATAQKLQVPYLIEYDKSVEGAPIVKDWIHDNGDGTYREFMTEWWWISDLPGGAKRPTQTDQQYHTSRQASWDFADEALAKLDAFFGAETTVTAPGAPAAPAVVVEGDDVTVSWGSQAATGNSPLTGFVVSLGDTTAVVAADAWTHTFADVPAGTYDVTLAAVNAVGTSPLSAATSAVVAAQPEEPSPSPQPGDGEGDAAASVTVTGDLRPGGKVVVTGSGLPASTPGVQVEIRSTPQNLGTVATAADGTFRLETTIPTAVDPGAHTIVVLVDGQVVASAAVTVTAAGLPATGGELPFAAMGAALVLLVAGVVLQVVRRRRQAA